MVSVACNQRTAERVFDAVRAILVTGFAAALLIGSPAQAADRPLVAVVDGGVARTAELEGVLVGEIDVVAVPERPPFQPTNPHGTLVATVLHRAAEGAVDIVSVRIDDPAGCPEGAAPPCQPDALTIASAIHAAVDLGVDAINLSLAMPDDPAIISAVRRAAESGVKVVLAAGNDGADRPGNLKAAIAGYPSAVLVGALDWTGAAWASSNQPDEGVGKTYSYVWRPGVGVDTIDADGRPSRASGTSIAAPIETAFIVAGKPARPVTQPSSVSDRQNVVDEAPPEVVVTSAVTATDTSSEPASIALPRGVHDLALGAALGLAFLAGRLGSALSFPRATNQL